MKYYNSTTKHAYTGGSMTIIKDGVLFSGVPTKEQLQEWGYEEVVATPYTPTEEDLKRQRMADIQAELAATDYLSLKAFEGEDMSDHVGWKEARAALRAEYRRLENEVDESEVPEEWLQKETEDEL